MGEAVIYFRCTRCAGTLRADGEAIGREVVCSRCGQGNVCPERSASLRPAALPLPGPATREEAARWPRVSLVQVASLAFVVVATVWAVWSAVGRPQSMDSSTPASPARLRQQEILRATIGQPGDPDLAKLFDEINRRHFAGGLPPTPVRWEPRLREVGELAGGAFTLEGMFGHVRDETIILLNPSLQSDAAAVQRTLSHEMVHAYLYSIGDPSTDHGPAFQAALRRLAGEGAFPGIAAGVEERATLRAWLESESARLEAEHEAALREGAEIERERAELEQLLAALTAAAENGSGPDRASVDAFNARREAYDSRVRDANMRAERGRADVAEFNKQVERYRLMLEYPDGLDTEALTLPRTAAAAPAGSGLPPATR